MDNRRQFEDYYIKWEKALNDGFVGPNTPQTINEEEKVVEEGKAQRLSNPVSPTSSGPDGALDDKALSATYSIDDIKNLEELKLQLHNLADKMAELKDDSKLESKMSKLQKKIDDLSNELNSVIKK